MNKVSSLPRMVVLTGIYLKDSKRFLNLPSPLC